MTPLEAISIYKKRSMAMIPESLHPVLFHGHTIVDNPWRMVCEGPSYAFPVRCEDAMAFIPTAWTFQETGNPDSCIIFILMGVIPEIEQDRLIWALHQLQIMQFWCDPKSDERCTAFLIRALDIKDFLP